MLSTRIAPTPSGFLHMGNILNFLITGALARLHKGMVHLRIDDCDQTRVRDEYLEDIFETLKWLGIDYDHGPRSMTEFKQNYSQSQLFPEIKNFLTTTQQIFSCSCSRKDILKMNENGKYSGVCYENKELLFKSSHCLRLKTKSLSKLELKKNNEVFPCPAELFDLIVWKKDQSPSYQVASIFHDLKLGINTIIRGEDLLPSTFIQSYLATLWKLDGFKKIDFHHHSLIQGKEGVKLSKSTQKDSHLSIRNEYQNPKVFFEHLSESLAFKINGPEDFYQNFPAVVWDKIEIN